MEGIQISINKAGPNGEVSVIKVGGYIDTTTSAEVEHALSKLLSQKSTNIVIDLGNVDYVSSAGWGIFISEIKQIRQNGGDLKLAKMIPEVVDVFELLEFHYILKSFPTVEQAVGDFGVDAGRPVSHAAPEKHHIEKNPAPEMSVSQSNESDTISELLPQTLEEKIVAIVKKNPELDAKAISGILKTSEYGHVSISSFKLRGVLKKMGLKSPKERQEFARQN